MQRWFTLSACALLAASIVWVDSRMWTIPQPANIDRFAMTIEPVAIDATAPRGWTVGGAWILRGNDRAFSGLSGLAIDPHGKLVGVTDRGILLRFGEIGTGRSSVVFASPIDPTMRAWDAEAVESGAGALAIAHEAEPVLGRRVDGRMDYFRLPGFPTGNRGAEALFSTGNRLYAIGEDGRRAAWFSHGRQGEAQLTGATDSPTGAARWPGRSDGLLLQRGLGLTGFRAGVSTLEARKSDRLVAGPLQRLGLAWNDNAEGLAIGASDDGFEVWIVTDNNGKAPQRTILVRYDVAKDGWPFDERAAARP